MIPGNADLQMGVDDCGLLGCQGCFIRFKQLLSFELDCLGNMHRYQSEGGILARQIPRQSYPPEAPMPMHWVTAERFRI